MEEEKKDKENNEVVASSEDLKFDPTAFDRFFDKMSTAMGSGQVGPDGLPVVKEMRNRSALITLYEDQYKLDTFDAPIQVELVELTPEDELIVLKKLEGISEQALSVELGKASIRSLNGKFLQPDQKELLWKALNTAGRMAIGLTFMTHCSGMASEAMGNSIAGVVLK